MAINPVGWFEIYVDDMARAKRFYESVFRLKLEKLSNPTLDLWAFPANMERFGCGGALAKMDGVCAGGNSTLVYFSCADCAVEVARAKASDGLIFREKMSIGEYGFIALVVDTEGNMIGLHSMQ